MVWKMTQKEKNELISRYPHLQEKIEEQEARESTRGTEVNIAPKKSRWQKIKSGAKRVGKVADEEIRSSFSTIPGSLPKSKRKKRTIRKVKKVLRDFEKEARRESKGGNLGGNPLGIRKPKNGLVGSPAQKDVSKILKRKQSACKSKRYTTRRKRGR